MDPPGICALCHRTLSSENEPADLESASICGDCKFLYLEENGTPSSNVTRIAPRIRRTRYGNSSESEGFDSVYAESDIISTEAYEDNSDVSVDVHSVYGGDSDTDIDPMHAGLNQWISDDEDEYEELEDHDNTILGSLIARVQFQRYGQYGQSPEIERDILVRISERRRVHGSNPFGNTDNDHSGDYVDARSFEELLERLAEEDTSRRGAPPASVSFVNNLDRVLVNDMDHNDLTCSICKDSLTIGTMVNRLPCLHLYHTSCIKPWLSTRNSCPLCRFEVPTDDVEYENQKQSISEEIVVREIEPREEDGSFGEREGLEIVNDGGGRRWMFVAAPLVSLVGIGLALWLGNRRAVTGSVSCGISPRGNRSRRWWGLF